MLFNRIRALEIMDRYGPDVLIATTPVNITYFSDYYCWLDPLFKEYMLSPGASNRLLLPAFAVFPREGEPALILSPTFAVNATGLWVKDLHLVGTLNYDFSVKPSAISDPPKRLIDHFQNLPSHATPVEALISVLQERGLMGARIGLELEGLSYYTHEKILQHLPTAEVKDCGNLIRLIRMVKTQEEVSRLRRAAEISEMAAMEALALARPGQKISRLAQHFRARVAEMGADFDHFAFGLHGLGIAMEPEYELEIDDILYVDFGCIYKHYISDSGVTLAISQPTNELLERYLALRDCVDSAVRVSRAGAPASTTCQAMWETLNHRGITASFPHGHGLGLEVRDYPILVKDNGLRIRDGYVDVPSDLPLEPEMVINFEAAMFLPAVASLQIEQTFVVTTDGCQPLIPQTRSYPVQPL
jgi:Xaa-Pro dipeptidase